VSAEAQDRVDRKGGSGTIRARNADAARSALSAQFGGLLDGNAAETATRNQPQSEAAKVMELSGSSG